MPKFPEQTPERKVPTEQEIRLAMLELRQEIKTAQAVPRKLAPRWDPKTVRLAKPFRMM
jgi:hypothetical protein